MQKMEVKFITPSPSLNKQNAYSILNESIESKKIQQQEKFERQQQQLSYTSFLENASSDNLSSDKSINYLHLRDLLKAKKWEEADYETYLMMLLVMNRKEGDWLKNDDFLNFPCTDLCTIDRLWLKYSDGHFGFSVQKEIYLSVGGKPDGKYCEEAWKKFRDRVGWVIDYSKIDRSKTTFDTSAPKGHLPQRWTPPLLPGARGFYLVCVSALVARLVSYGS